MISWLVCLGLFVAYLFVDALYVLYTKAVVKQRPIYAANVGTLMYFMSAYGIINYTHNWLYILPIAAGSWLGTYLTVKLIKDE